MRKVKSRPWDEDPHLLGMKRKQSVTRWARAFKVKALPSPVSAGSCLVSFPAPPAPHTGVPQHPALRLLGKELWAAQIFSPRRATPNLIRCKGNVCLLWFGRATFDLSQYCNVRENDSVLTLPRVPSHCYE